MENNYKARLNNIKNIKLLMQNLRNNKFEETKAKDEDGIAQIVFTKSYDDILFERFKISAKSSTPSLNDLYFNHAKLRTLRKIIKRINNDLRAMLVGMISEQYLQFIIFFKTTEAILEFHKKLWQYNFDGILNKYQSFFDKIHDKNYYDIGKNKGMLFMACNTDKDIKEFYGFMREYHDLADYNYLDRLKPVMVKSGRPPKLPDIKSAIKVGVEKAVKTLGARFTRIHEDILKRREHTYNRINSKQITELADLHQVGDSLIKEIQDNGAYDTALKHVGEQLHCYTNAVGTKKLGRTQVYNILTSEKIEIRKALRWYEPILKRLTSINYQ
jgi:hypothetical protein